MTPALRIVLTGGPSAGKTTLASVLSRELAGKVSVVPEAASILFSGGFPRGNLDFQKIRQQRSIYFIQKELEDLIRERNGEKILICDRGTLDGIAYWPGPAGDFFRSVGTTLQDEIKRYDVVIHLETAPEGLFDYGNTSRTETRDEAVLIDEKIKAAWESHPRRYLISSSKSFSAKIVGAIALIKELQTE